MRSWKNVFMTHSDFFLQLIVDTTSDEIFHPSKGNTKCHKRKKVRYERTTVLKSYFKCRFLLGLRQKPV